MIMNEDFTLDELEQIYSGVGVSGDLAEKIFDKMNSMRTIYYIRIDKDYVKHGTNLNGIIRGKFDKKNCVWSENARAVAVMVAAMEPESTVTLQKVEKGIYLPEEIISIAFKTKGKSESEHILEPTFKYIDIPDSNNMTQKEFAEKYLPKNCNRPEFIKNFIDFLYDSEYTDEKLAESVWLMLNREWRNGENAGRNYYND
jgi:hypothetical protein